MKRKILAILLSCGMICSMFSGTVFAAEEMNQEAEVDREGTTAFSEWPGEQQENLIFDESDNDEGEEILFQDESEESGEEDAEAEEISVLTGEDENQSQDSGTDEQVEAEDMFSDEETQDLTVYAGNVTASGKINSSIIWTVYADGELVIEGTGDIPSYYQVSPPWLKYRNKLTSITLESGITGIGDSAFTDCVNVKSVSMKSGITFIEAYAFYACGKLTDIKLPETVTSIGEGVWGECRSLTNIEIPKGVKKLENNLFYGCTSLSEVMIPNSIQSIEPDLFTGCSNLKTVRYNGSEEAWKELRVHSSDINNATVYFCEHKRRYGVRTIKRATCTEEGLEFITCYDCDYWGKVVPPSHRWNQFYTIDKRVSASEAGQESLHCSVCDAIKEDSVREIIYGQQEVVNNQKVNDSITWSLSADGELQINGSGDMPSGDSYWKEYKDRIVKITISDGITSIGNYTFGQCHNLTDVSIPQSVTSIGSGVFSSCTSLEEITIPESVSIMGMNVFNDCTSLLRIKLPDKVVRIESMMFDGCKKLKEVVCSPKLNYIGSYAFNGCTNLEKAPLSDTVRKIEMYAFAGCTNLKSITVPQNVTILDAGVFCRCTGITEINIPSGVTAIGAHALLNCTNLKCIELPSSVTSISKNAFWKEGWPTGLEIIRFKGTKAQWDAFQLSSEEINNAEVFCEYDSAHEHVYEAIIIDEAQCMASGRQKLTCKKCGYSYEEEIPATGHSWNAGEITKEATCEEKGEKAYTCANCGNTKAEEIPATGHAEVKDEAVEATCEKDGLTEGSHCSVCGKVLEEQKAVLATGHSWNAGEITKKATCEEVGVKTYTCANCGNTKTEDIPATGHTEVKDAAVEATCEKSGLTEGSHCCCEKVLEAQKIIPATGHTEVKDEAVEATCEKDGLTEGSHCSVCKKVLKAQETIPATGHKWNTGEITKEATCEEKGVKTYTCANCEKIRTEEIPATGHTEVKDEAVAATCEKDGLTEGSHCSVCKKVLKAQETIPSTGHKFGAWKTTHPADVFSVEKQSRSCSECGKEEEREVGSKLEKTITVSVSSFPLKMKQKTKVLKVTGLADGDSIVSWKSSNTKIVKVSGKSNGTSTITAGKKTGKARITITLKSGLKKVITVSVQKNTVKTKKISGVSKNLKLKRKQKATLHPVIAPLTSIQKITYKSNNTKIVTVNSKGQITAKKKGTAVITVKSGNKTTKCKVTVK
ncbi:MAG: leucine-rich repeat protein [Blautia sp.]